MNPHPNDPKGESGSKKTPLQLLPPYALAQIALAHKEGAEKYGPWNWRQTGVCATTYIGAIMRHLAAWQDGEDIDPDSGLSHIAKIGACCNILLDAEHCGKLVDDRSKVGVTQRTEAFREMLDSLPKLQPTGNVLAKKSLEEMLRDLFKDTPPVSPEQALVEDIGSALGKAVNERIANSWAEKLSLELPEGLPPLPPVPEGYDRWEYRGMGWKDYCYLEDGSDVIHPIAYSNRGYTEWTIRTDLSGHRGEDFRHYLEAVK